ncbi:MAG: hypothetical protein LAP61_13460 [Acidobacteriia bacterium]|nr:hypothetical protein [Terriglobia bacterium]
MRDIRRYWSEVRALETSLPEFVWLVDVEGSAPVEVTARRAAQLLLAKSHRLASEEELSVQRAKEVAAGKRLQKERRRKEGVAVVTPSGGDSQPISGN